MPLFVADCLSSLKATNTFGSVVRPISFNDCPSSHAIVPHRAAGGSKGSSSNAGGGGGKKGGGVVAKVASSIAKSIVSSIRRSVPSPAAKSPAATKQTASSIGSRLSKAISSVSNTAKTLSHKASSRVSTVYKNTVPANIRNSISKVGNTVAGRISSAVNSAGAFAHRAAGTVWNKAKRAASSVAKSVSTAWNNAKRTGGSSLIQRAGALATRVGSGAAKSLTSFANRTKSSLHATWNHAKQAGSTMMQRAGEFARHANSSVSAAWNSAKRYATSSAQSARHLLSRAQSGFRNAWSNTTQRVHQSLSATANRMRPWSANAWGTISQHAQQPWQGLRNFGMHAVRASPSFLQQGLSAANSIARGAAFLPTLIPKVSSAARTIYNRSPLLRSVLSRTPPAITNAINRYGGSAVATTRGGWSRFGNYLGLGTSVLGFASAAATGNREGLIRSGSGVVGNSVSLLSKVPQVASKVNSLGPAGEIIGAGGNVLVGIDRFRRGNELGGYEAVGDGAVALGKVGLSRAGVPGAVAAGALTAYDIAAPIVNQHAPDAYLPKSVGTALGDTAYLAHKLGPVEYARQYSQQAAKMNDIRNDPRINSNNLLTKAIGFAGRFALSSVPGVGALATLSPGSFNPLTLVDTNRQLLQQEGK